MPITTTNKIVNLLLVGGLVFLILVWIFLNGFWGANLQFNFTTNLSDLSPIFSIVGVAILFSFLILLGAIIAGVAALIIRPILRFIKTNHQKLFIFGRPDGYHYLAILKKQYVSLIEKTEFHQLLIDTDQSEKLISPQGIFLKTANSEHIQWMIRHYATYDLVSQFLAILILAWPVFIKTFAFVGTPNLIMLNIGYLFSFYALIRLAISRNLYSYELAYRQAIIYLIENYLPSMVNQAKESK